MKRSVESTGDQDLLIDRVQVRGDDRCVFSNVTDQDIDGKRVPPGQTTTIRTIYRPRVAGEDHAELRVLPNAQNFPELRLLVCGLAEDPSAPPPEGDAPDPSHLLCRTADTIASCH